MNETTNTEKDFFKVSIEKIAKSKYKYTIDNKSILWNIDHKVRNDFFINSFDNENKQIKFNVSTAKPYLSFKALILFQNMKVTDYIKHLEKQINNLKSNTSKQIKDILPINNKIDLQNFIYNVALNYDLNANMEHLQPTTENKTINKNNDANIKQIIENFKLDTEKRTAKDYLIALESHLLKLIIESKINKTDKEYILKNVSSSIIKTPVYATEVFSFNF